MLIRRRPGPATWALPLVPAVVMLGVGGYGAGHRQLWEDEYATWHASTLGLADFTRLIGHIDLALSPYYLFMQGWIFAFGDSPLALRAPSVLAMAAAAGLVTAVGRTLFDHRVGLLAGLLFVAVPSVSRYAQEARPYAIAVALSVLATLLLLRALDRPTWPRWFAYGGACVLLGLVHLVALSIVVGHLLMVRSAGLSTGRLRVWRFLAAVVLVLAVVGPFALAAAGESQAIAWIAASRGTLRAFPGQLFGSGPVAAVAAGLAVVGIYLRVRWDSTGLPLLAAWAIAPPVLAYVTVSGLHLFHHRYLLFTLPAWVLLAAAGVDALATRAVSFLTVRSVPRATAVTLAAGAAVLAATAWLGAAGQVTARADPLAGYPDFRRASQIIRADVRPGDAIIYGGLQFRTRRAMTYENRGQLRPRDILLARSAEELGQYTGRECPDPVECLGATRRVWLTNAAGGADPFAELARPVATMLAERFTVVDTWRLPHLNLTLLTLEPEPTSDR